MAELGQIIEVVVTTKTAEVNALLNRGWELLTASANGYVVTYSVGRPRYVEAR